VHHEADVLVAPHYAADGVILQRIVCGERYFVHLGERLQDVQLVLVVFAYLDSSARDCEVLALDAGAILQADRRDVLPKCKRRNLLQNLQALVLL